MNSKDTKDNQQWETGDPAIGQLLIELCRQVRLGELARARKLLGGAALANITPAVWERIGTLPITKTWRVEGEEPQKPSDAQLTRALLPYANLPDLEMDGGNIGIAYAWRSPR